MGHLFNNWSVFIHKRKNKSGSVSILILKKVNGHNKVIYYLGTAKNEYELDYLLKVAEKKLIELRHGNQLSIFKNKTAEAQLFGFFSRFLPHKPIRIGYYEIFGSTFDKLNLSSLIQEPIFKDLIISRIAKPNSKLATHRWLNDKLQRNIKKDEIYRFMDNINSSKQKMINDHIYRYVRDYVKEEINIIFFDATTLHFETFDTDNFRKTGFSKVGKHNQPQIVVGLMVTKEGLPLGYDVFPGNKWDGHTIIDALRKVKSKAQTGRVVFVADAGMCTSTNIKMIEKAGYEYIMADKLKNRSDEIKEQILNQNNYNIDNIFEMTIGSDHRLISHYSQDRARKDRTDREKSIEKTRRRISRKDKITKSVIKAPKYFELIGTSNLILNRDKVREDEKWDGIKGYNTNISDLSAIKIISRYHDLWQIEKAFRVSKQDLGIRPIHHRKKERIQAHIFLVFLSLLVSILTELELEKNGFKITTSMMLEQLDNVQEYIFEDSKTKEKFKFRPDLGDINKRIYETLNLSYHVGIQSPAD